MLSENEIKEVSRSLTQGNIAHAEKLYLQDIILSTVGRETSTELVFKGGTALLKLYQLDRFSEDLDFVLNGDTDLGKLLEEVERDLKSYGAKVQEKKVEEKERSFKARLGIEGPLFMGERRSLCFIWIEINTESGAKKAGNIRYTPRFKDITSFELAVMSEEEILAEKIRALRTRNQPRDLYDIYHLLSKNVEIDTELVQEKLDYYDLKHDPEKTLEEAGKLEKNWETLENLTYSKQPGFEDALNKLREALE